MAKDDYDACLSAIRYSYYTINSYDNNSYESLILHALSESYKTRIPPNISLFQSIELRRSIIFV